jgi:hypothetical protein
MRSLALLLAVLLLAPGRVRGEVRCADAAAYPALAGVPVEQRIAFLRQRLEAARSPARTWSWTFGAVNGALTVGQAAGAAVVQGHAEKAILAAGAATSALAVAQITVLAPIVPSEQDLAPVDDLCAQLQRLEGALSRGARNEKLGTGVAAHVANFVINAGFGVATGLVAKRAGPGLATFAFGWGLGTAQILTEPTGLMRALDRYRAGELYAGGDEPSRPRWQVLVAGATVGVRMDF